MPWRVVQAAVPFALSLVPGLLARAQASAPRAAAFESYSESIPGSKVTFEMVAIPAGSLTLGSPSGEPGRGADESPQVRVSLGAFWMGRHEVTWSEFDLFAFGMRGPLATAGGPPAGVDAVTRPTPPYADEAFGYGKGRQPALSMTHHAAMEYCRWLSQRTGRVYRLPTEAEWEYACRAGSSSRYGFGDDEAALADHAWYRVNAEDRPRPVSGRKPNGWGLFDMHGNLAEWTLDRYEEGAYAHWAARPGPPGPVLLPDERHYPHVVRGGSWDDPAERLRCAARRASDPSWNRRDPQRPQSIWWLTDATHVGFRVVRALEEQPELRGLRSRVTREGP
jgi:formylglycine-generating enzyme required for sulfatase activity